MRWQAGLRQVANQFFESIGEQMGVMDRHWGQSHDGAVAAGMLRRIASSPGIACFFETAQSTAGRDADVEAPIVDRVFAFAPPGNITAGLIVEVPADAGDAVGQGQGHARIVGPLSRGQAMRATTLITGHLREAAGYLEFDGRAEGITYSEADEGSALAI